MLQFLGRDGDGDYDYLVMNNMYKINKNNSLSIVHDDQKYK